MRSWEGLNGLRGIAVIAMVIGHSFIGWYDYVPLHNWFWITMTQFCSSAPVLFFFSVGVGPGMKRGRKAGGLLPKTALLVFADLCLVWANQYWIGVDFLGFIAWSALAIELIRRQRHPEPLALSLIGLLLVGRYIVGHFVQMPALAMLLGKAPIPAISYNPFPWLIFPLLGFLFGRSLRRLQELPSGFVPAAFASGFALIGLAQAASLAGLSLHRFGSMGVAFFIQSLGVIALAVALSTAWHTRWLALRGVACLMVVPVHYALIKAVREQLVPSEELFWPLVFAVITLSFTASRWLASQYRFLQRRSGQALAACLMLLALGHLLVFTDAPLAIVWSAYLGQILICLFMATASAPRQQAA